MHRTSTPPPPVPPPASASERPRLEWSTARWMAVVVGSGATLMAASAVLRMNLDPAGDERGDARSALIGGIIAAVAAVVAVRSRLRPPPPSDARPAPVVHAPAPVTPRDARRERRIEFNVKLLALRFGVGAVGLAGGLIVEVGRGERDLTLEDAKPLVGAVGVAVIVGEQLRDRLATRRRRGATASLPPPPPPAARPR